MASQPRPRHLRRPHGFHHINSGHHSHHHAHALRASSRGHRHTRLGRIGNAARHHPLTHERQHGRGLAHHIGARVPHRWRTLGDFMARTTLPLNNQVADVLTKAWPSAMVEHFAAGSGS